MRAHQGLRYRNILSWNAFIWCSIFLRKHLIKEPWPLTNCVPHVEGTQINRVEKNKYIRKTVKKSFVFLFNAFVFFSMWFSFPVLHAGWIPGIDHRTRKRTDIKGCPVSMVPAGPPWTNQNHLETLLSNLSRFLNFLYGSGPNSMMIRIHRDLDPDINKMVDQCQNLQHW